MVGDAPEGPGIDDAEGAPGQGAAHVVQLGVGVDGGDHGQAGGLLQKRAHQIAPGSVAVDDVIALPGDFLPQGLQSGQGIAGGNHVHVDAQRPGLLGEGAVGKAHHVRLDVLVQPPEQGVDVGFRPAGVSAADEMDDFHGETSKNPCLWTGDRVKSGYQHYT